MGVRLPENDFYSLHGIWGAYASLALGRLGRGAGVVVGDVHPPETGLFAGYRVGGEEPRLLPFASGLRMGAGASAFKEDDVDPDRSFAAGRVSWFRSEEIERSMDLSSETWRAGALSLRVLSFFGDIPDPRGLSPRAARAALLPALYLELGFDNSGGEEPLVGLFGMQGIGRPLSDLGGARLLGMAKGVEWGFAARPAADIEELMDWSLIEAAFAEGPEGRSRPLRHLAIEGGLRFLVGPGEQRSYLLALGVFRDGVLSAGLPAQAYHASLFRGLEDVLETALDEAEGKLALARDLDLRLEAAGLGEERRFLLAHAAHSYAASTELLLTAAGESLFVVNEGEYRMMNTLDLTVDHLFWESRFSPWTIRNELESLLERSAYEDGLGLAFAHDQGVADSFTPPGRSSYELSGLSDCFSYMSFEETLNWSLSACLYASLCSDLEWAAGRREVLASCLRSIAARDGNGDGIMDRDSDRCAGGAEITTYDSLDLSLGQARNNLYLGVKTWAAFVCLGGLLERLDGGPGPETELASRLAAAAARTIAGKFVEAEGYIPAVFESDNRSRIIPAIEGLAYPGFCGLGSALDPAGPHGALVAALRRHLDTVLSPGLCLDPESGGWKLSSTSRNTWLSKIFLNQFVAERVLGFEDERTRRDGVHARWLRLGSADHGATDQVDSATGRDLGSRLYPRLVTSILWTWDGTRFRI